MAHTIGQFWRCYMERERYITVVDDRGGHVGQYVQRKYVPRPSGRQPLWFSKGRSQVRRGQLNPVRPESPRIPGDLWTEERRSIGHSAQAQGRSVRHNGASREF